jgi:enoyl-CoA hydratase/carnithine racemase/DNA-binding transcriptional regulator YiaG
MPGELHVDRPADAVLRLTIFNPEKRNALDHELLDAIADAVTGAEAAGMRAIVLTGEGGMFSSGYDIGDTDDAGFQERAERLVAHPFTSAIDALDACDVPVLAALTGHTIGGGLELALGCDLRLAADGVKLGMPPAKLGLVYSHTGLRRFLDVVGEARTRELFLLGRHIGAREAQAWGLVNAVVPERELEATALEWAAELAANAPLAQRGNKQVLRALLRAEGELAPGVEEELVALRQACFGSDDFREGVRAFAEKRRAALARALTAARRGAARRGRVVASATRSGTNHHTHADRHTRHTRSRIVAAMDGGRVIRESRERHGVSQRSLAVRAGTSQGYVSQVERGEVSPSVEAVGRLLACLGEQGRIETEPLPAAPMIAADATVLEPGPVLAALAGRDVAFVVVGALAARAHGALLPAAAIEVTLDPEPRNQEHLTRALGDLQARMAGVQPTADGSRALADGATFAFTTTGGRLVLAPNGVRHVALARRAVTTKLEGVAVPCAGRDDLINRSRPGGVAEDPVLLGALTGRDGA